MNININFADGSIQGKRKEQQDAKANLIIPNSDYILYVLTDGMGGHAGGKIASSLVKNAFLRFFQENSIDKDPKQLLQEALTFANNQVALYLADNPALNGMGTTVIAFLFNQKTNNYYFLSVGDSPLYKYNKSGIKRINANHAYYEELLEKVSQGKITQQQADTDPNRHSITSAITGKKIALVDYNTGTLKDDELLLLASDGIQTLDDSPNGELEKILATNNDFSTIVDDILKSIEDKNQDFQDNATVILIGSNNHTPAYSDTKTNVLVSQTSNKKNKDILILLATFILVVIAVIYSLYFTKSEKLPDSKECPNNIETILDEPIESQHSTIKPSISLPRMDNNNRKQNLRDKPTEMK